MEDSSQKNRVARISSKAFATTVGAAAGGPAGALVGAVVEEALFELVQKSWGELNGRAMNRVGSLIAQAAAEGDLPPEELVAKGMADAVTEQVLRDAMRAAANAHDDVKVAALARALANGLADDFALIDESALVIAALADLMPVHVRALAAVCKAEVPLPEPEVASAAGVTTGNLQAITAALNRHGLVDMDVDFVATLDASKAGEEPPTDPPAWGRTPFGETCWRYLSQAAQALGETSAGQTS